MLTLIDDSIFEKLQKITKGASDLFTWVINNRSPVTNTVVIDPYKIETEAAKRHTTKIKTQVLIDNNFLKKITVYFDGKKLPKHSYLINPRYIHCVIDQYHIKELWDSL